MARSRFFSWSRDRTENRYPLFLITLYFEGKDQARGIGRVGHVTFKPDTMHDLRSCSKSIVGLLYGISLQQEKVPPPEAPLFPPSSNMPISPTLRRVIR